MTNHMWIVATVTLVMGVTSVLAAIPGPNDPRYPDYIVNPPVVCNKEGSYPHPRNCSWYYRCVDRMKVGYFWTYHFECEPGTVFLDELDQCIHPFDAPYACKSVPPKPEPSLKCEGVIGTCTDYDICFPAKVKKTMCREIQCPLRTPNLSCGDGYSFDMKTQECAPIPTASELCPLPTPPPPIFNCRGVPGTCEVYEVCKPQRQNMTMCSEIECPIRNPNLKCGPGYSFHIETQKCATIPKDSDLCPITPVLCEGVPGTCQIYDVCTPKKESRLLCREIRCPLREPNLSCGDGFWFDMKSQKCVQPPGDSELCGADITVQEIDLLPCAYNGHIPETDFVKRQFCDTIPLCDGTKFLDAVELCTGYYECKKTVTGSYTAEERSCPKGLLYSFESRRCEPSPTLEERCKFI